MTRPARTKRGWLRAESLESGLREQSASMDGRTLHSIELRYVAGRDGFAVVHQVLCPCGFDERFFWFFARQNLPAAREKFTDRVDHVRSLTLASD